MKERKTLTFCGLLVYEHEMLDSVECKTLFGIRYYRRVGNIVSWFGLFTYVREFNQ